jgi:Rod binding domain-containing protein
MTLQPLTSTPTTSQDDGAASSKLVKSAREFEAILLQSWLEKMNQSFVGSSESQDAAHDTVSSLGTQAIATALAARGGVGIARMLLRQLQTAGTAGEGRPTSNSSQGLKVQDAVSR